jgi:phytoene synthase
MRSQLEHAYAVCRGIARSSAKNFYYAFLVLPGEKRDALCAVYAFMRYCDDICDAPGLTLEQRKEKLAAWLDALHRVLAGDATDDPVLMAVADAQKRFEIRSELFDQLVHGTAMDLPSGGGAIVYRTFEDLRKYCYYVASVVGLVAIKIFGYRDPKAEALAEECGVAFQLTNILRDVKEDARMGRVYLPEEDLARCGRTPADLDPARLGNGFDVSTVRPVLELVAERARGFYNAANELMPLIDEDSRPALWTLVEIYRRLLEKIARRNYDVFSERVRLTVPEKLGVLSRGFLLRLTA